MVEFGALSSVFDFVTFAVLIGVFHATPAVFQTSWFVESLLTELAVVFVMRTERAFFRSRPGRVLLVTTLVLIPITFAIPFAPFAGVFGFVPLPVHLVGAIVLVAALYAAGGLQFVVWGFCVSTVLVYHATFSINSLAHRFGSRRYATRDASRNNFWLALVTFGEGWHNNHHHYPASARQGFFWWEVDLTYYGLRLLALLGIVRGLKPVPASVRRAGGDMP